MKTVKYVSLCWLLVFGMIALGGCKGKKADENKPVDESKTAESTPVSEPKVAESAPATESTTATEVKVDESAPVSEVKTQAETMDTTQLRTAAMAYKEAIAAKKAELDKVAAQLKEIPVTDLLGEKAKQLKTDVDNFTKSIGALKERFDVFYTGLKAKNGDLSGLQL